MQILSLSASPAFQAEVLTTTYSTPVQSISTLAYGDVDAIITVLLHCDSTTFNAVKALFF